ncbi:MAG TPA: biotin--[acetyl-CoA-carboxylase] ligase [Pirellula sp.]|nr:biotin--[acetyl-CoA-carboxylase] ligase [Pirellula sp.]
MNLHSISHLRRRFAIEEIEGLGYFQSIQWVDSVDSTNKQLIQMVRQQSIALPALLAADRQSFGIGRGNNQWWSPAGCLMFSMAIPIDQSGPSSLKDRFVNTALLPLRVGCVVAECLEQFSSVKPLVKWPNDVYLSGRKVCGVLIEVIPKPLPANSVAVIGIGINCRVDLREAPGDVRANATSLSEWARQGFFESTSTENILVQFVHQWLTIDQRQHDNPLWLLEHWPERSLLDGQWVEIKHPAGLAQGLCLGINPSGAILVRNEQLEVIEVLAGTVQSFRPLG